ncbi:hypothetical protein JCM16303_005269 [Sporobolomyces ruberrimus]
MPSKKVYPRPADPREGESYQYRPSSPINQHSPLPSRSLFSRSPKPSKPPREVTRIPWETSNSPPQRVPSSTSSCSPPTTNLARPSSPISTCSYTSSNSSSRWSSNQWNSPNSNARQRQASGGRSQDIFYHSPNLVGGEGWSEDEGDDDDGQPITSGSGSKKEGRKRGIMKQAFGIQKKSSNFSLRGLIRRGGGRESFEHDHLSPPPSPTMSFPSSSSSSTPLNRQVSSPDLAKKGTYGIPRSSPGSPMLPLPSLPSTPRERTMSSPMYTSPESGSVRGKAARFLGEEIVPHGKAARLLGLERKPTLRQRPSINSLAESMRSNGSFPNPPSHTASPESSSTDLYGSPPSTTIALPASSDISAGPTAQTSPVSPPRKQHRHIPSASDPFWQTVSAQQHQPPSRSLLDLEELAEDETSDASPVIPPEARFSRDSSRAFGLSPVPPSPPSDPTDSVYISDDRNHSSLYSLSLDLNHLSTFSSISNLRSALSEDSEIENLVRGSSSSFISTRIRSPHSSLEADQQGRKLSPTESRLSHSPTTSTSSPRTSSRQSQNVLLRRSTNSTRISLSSSSPILPPPSTALPPLPPLSTLFPSSSSFPSSFPPSKPSTPSFILHTTPPPAPAPTTSLPRLPPLDSLPSFLSSPSSPSSSSSKASSPISPGPSSSPTTTTATNGKRPTRSNTIVSVASVGTRTRQYSNALEALEGRARKLGTEAGQGGDGNGERGSRKRAAVVRRKNREEQNVEKVEKGEKEVQTTRKGEVQGEKGKTPEGSFLDLDGSDESGDEEGAVLEESIQSVELEPSGGSNAVDVGEETKKVQEAPRSSTLVAQCHGDSLPLLSVVGVDLDFKKTALDARDPEKDLAIPVSSLHLLLSPTPPLDLPRSLRFDPHRLSISSISSSDSCTSDSSLFSDLPTDVTASSFPRPPSSFNSLPYLAPSISPATSTGSK